MNSTFRPKVPGGRGVVDLELDEIEETPPYIDLQDDDEDTDDEAELISAEEFAQSLQLPRRKLVINESAIAAGFREIRSCKATNGNVLTAEKCVELSDKSLFAGDFLYILHIFHHRVTSAIILRGVLLRRNLRILNRMPKTRNELSAILGGVHPDEHNPRMEDYYIDIPIDDSGCIRELVFTNKIPGNWKFGDESFRDGSSLPPADHQDKGVREEAYRLIEDEAVLVCRYKYVEYLDPLKEDSREFALIRLREVEASSGKGIPDAALVYWWRFLEAQGKRPTQYCPNHRHHFVQVSEGAEDAFQTRTYRRKRTVQSSEEVFSTSGGSFKRRKRSAQIQDDIHTPKRPERAESGQYPCEDRQPTIGDYCCGAGGASCGATQEGFLMVFGVDSNGPACESIRLNHENAKIFQMDIDKFLEAKLGDSIYIVDVVHFSPPCKTYSGANTRSGRGKNDAANEATGYSIIPICRRSRPRYFTLEQTSHIVTYGRNQGAFNALIHQFTAINYSVRFRIMDTSRHEDLQKRKRLIVIASCPGEPLPPYPKATHGTEPGLLPFRTMYDTFRRMPRHVEPHMAAFTDYQKKNKERIPFDARLKQRMKSITCGGGGDDSHWSGKRSLTVQELALCAGFPTTYKFTARCKTVLRTQIGNALSPKLSRAVYSMIPASLKKGNQEMRAWLKRKPEVISLHDEMATVEIGTETGKKRKRGMTAAYPVAIETDDDEDYDDKKEEEAEREYILIE